MSIKIMSAIFETEFRDLPTGNENQIVKASSLKLVLLAIADHANDHGESAYPGLTKIQQKTGMSRQGVINVIRACKFNGLLFVDDEPSKLGTNNYTVNLEAFPILRDREDERLLVNPVDQGSQPSLPELVNPVDLNHTLTVNEPSNGANAPIDLPLDWQIAGNQPIHIPEDKKAKMIDVANLIATGMPAAYEYALAFMQARDIIIPEGKIKAQRKPIREMIEMGVTPKHVKEATENLIEKGMTVTNLYSISKTAIDLANPAPDKSGYNPQGLSVTA